jgi:ATP-binding cassette subfamily F protein uup
VGEEESCVSTPLNPTLETQAKKELEWVRRMPSARQAKSKSRVARYEVLAKKAKSGKPKAAALTLNQGAANRIGGTIMELDGVSAKLPGGARDMVKDFSYEFQKRDRVGIVGANGVGKSSFLNLIAGRLSTTEGEIKQGETLVLGYYEQQGLEIPPEMTVLDYVSECGAISNTLSLRDVDAFQVVKSKLTPPSGAVLDPTRDSRT